MRRASDNPGLAPAVGLLITVAILAVLRDAAREIYRRLMDAVDPDLVDQADATLRDTVVCTLSLCAIADPTRAVQEMIRVLRPGGRLLLLDHVASSSRAVRAIQWLVERVTIPYGGEHFRRRPLHQVHAAGLDIEQQDRFALGIVERIAARQPAPRCGGGRPAVACAGTPAPATTSNDVSPKARPAARPSAASSATSPGRSTRSSRRPHPTWQPNPRQLDIHRGIYAGTSPITRASGKKKIMLARYVHNDRLVDALRCQAFSALRGSPGARAYYNALRARGSGHKAALRQLAHRLVGILHGRLKTRTPTTRPKPGHTTPTKINNLRLDIKNHGCLQARFPSR